MSLISDRDSAEAEFLLLGELATADARYSRLLSAFDAVVRSEAAYEEALRTIGAHNHDGVGRFARSVVEKGTT